MGLGPNWYCGVVSGGNPICSFRQFLARMCRFATIQNVTDDDDRRHRLDYSRPKKSAYGSTQPSLIAVCYVAMM